MKSKFFVLGIGLLLLFTTGCNKLKSRDRINKGIQSYKGAKYADAVEFFKEAVELDPTNVNGRLYLATAYMSQYIPRSRVAGQYAIGQAGQGRVHQGS